MRAASSGRLGVLWNLDTRVGSGTRERAVLEQEQEPVSSVHFEEDRVYAQVSGRLSTLG